MWASNGFVRVRIGLVLAVLLFLCFTDSVFCEKCTAQNKQKALYLEYTITPPLSDGNVTALTVETLWRNTSALRRYGKNGVFAAHPFGMIEKGSPGGYFGSQVAGKDSGGLLFSIWDGKGQRRARNCPSGINQSWCDSWHSFPLSANCHRHCLDCGLHPGWSNTTGTQCSIPVILNEGDSVMFSLNQIESNMSYVPDLPAPLNHIYRGSKWSLMAQISFANKTFQKVTIGTVFLENTFRGKRSLMLVLS